MPGDDQNTRVPRNERGEILPGRSGNPGGRPKGWQSYGNRWNYWENLLTREKLKWYRDNVDGQKELDRMPLRDSEIIAHMINVHFASVKDQRLERDQALDRREGKAPQSITLQRADTPPTAEDYNQLTDEGAAFFYDNTTKG